LKEVTQCLEELKNKAKQSLQKQLSQENLKTLKAAVDQQYHAFFSKDPTTLNDQDFQNYIACYDKNKSQLEKEIVGYEAVIKDTMKRLEVLNGTYQERLENIKKILDVNLIDISPTAILKSKEWFWDNNRKSAKITLSENNFVATRKEGSSYGAVFGNLEFRKGKYIWEVTMNAVSWIFFGIIANDASNSCEDIKHCPFSAYCVSSDGHISFKGKWQKYKSEVFNNKTFKCELNTVEGTFQITDNSNGVAVHFVQEDDLKVKVMLPFAMLHSPNDKVTLKPVESLEIE